MNKYKLLFLAFSCAQVALFSSCDTTVRGCNDTDALNYDVNATEDNGTCKYAYGGKNMGQIDVGSERDMDNEYTIYINGENVGRSLYYFPDGLSCGNPKAVGTIVEAGTHSIRAVGNGGTEIREGFVTVHGQDCKIVLIEQLLLQ